MDATEARTPTQPRSLADLKAEIALLVELSDDHAELTRVLEVLDPPFDPKAPLSKHDAAVFEAQLPELERRMAEHRAGGGRGYSVEEMLSLVNEMDAAVRH